MTGSALGTVVTKMNVIAAVAANAGCWRLFEGHLFQVAAGTEQRCMRTLEFETGFTGVIEFGLTPTSGVMARITHISANATVNIIGTVAGNTLAGGVFEVLVNMTRGTGRSMVSAGQRKVSSLGVIKRRFSPCLLCMTIRADLSQRTGVSIVSTMTRNAFRWCVAVFRVCIMTTRAD